MIGERFGQLNYTVCSTVVVVQHSSSTPRRSVEGTKIPLVSHLFFHSLPRCLSVVAINSRGCWGAEVEQ